MSSPYTYLFAYLFVVSVLIFLGFLFLIVGGRKQSVGWSLAGSFCLLSAPSAFYLSLQGYGFSEIGHLFVGFYSCLILSIIGFVNAYFIWKQARFLGYEEKEEKQP